MYAYGEGVPRDFAEAGKWFRKAANGGHAAAQFNLGAMYTEGQGVAREYAEAAKWYRKAADRGDAKTQFNLGLMYAEAKACLGTTLKRGNGFGRQPIRATPRRRPTLASRMRTV